MRRAWSEIELPLPRVASGKVREIFALGDERLLFVASDRISAFDCVLPTAIPDKGRVLTGLSAFWFRKLGKTLGPTHLVSTDPDDLPDNLAPHQEMLDGRFMIVRRMEVVPIECVVRGYLAGSAARSYARDGTVHGIPLADGLQPGDRLPEPLFTPTTKAEAGEHDEPLSFEAVGERVGPEVAEELKRRSLAIFEAAGEHARQQGMILVDTKFEFGRDPETGELVWIDEVLTPDSSRYWRADEWEPGNVPEPWDKQLVRNHLLSTDWDRTPPAPSLPAAIVSETRKRYVTIYEILTGKRFGGKEET